MTNRKEVHPRDLLWQKYRTGPTDGSGRGRIYRDEFDAMMDEMDAAPSAASAAPAVSVPRDRRINNLRRIAADVSVNNFARSICAEAADFLDAAPSTAQVPVDQVKVPLSEVINTPCKGCGKRPIDFISGSPVERTALVKLDNWFRQFQFDGRVPPGIDISYPMALIAHTLKTDPRYPPKQAERRVAQRHYEYQDPKGGRYITIDRRIAKPAAEPVRVDGGEKLLNDCFDAWFKAGAHEEFKAARTAVLAKFAELQRDFEEALTSNGQAWGICNAVAATLGDDLNHAAGSAKSVLTLKQRATTAEAELAALKEYLHTTTDADGEHHRDWVADCQQAEAELAALETLLREAVEHHEMTATAWDGYTDAGDCSPQAYAELAKEQRDYNLSRAAALRKGLGDE
jgi:hypothetical protein